MMPVSRQTPSRFGPSHWGQSSAFESPILIARPKQHSNRRIISPNRFCRSGCARESKRRAQPDLHQTSGLAWDSKARQVSTLHILYTSEIVLVLRPVEPDRRLSYSNQTVRPLHKRFVRRDSSHV